MVERESPLLIPIRDAARTLGVGRTTVYGLIANRKLVRVNIGARALITERAVREYVQSLVAHVAQEDP